MIDRSSFRTGAAVLCGLCLCLSSCAKRVESPDGAFEAQQSVVISFQGDRSVQGKMDTGSNVLFTDAGTTYNARIQSLSEQNIILEELVLVQEAGSVQEVAYRLADARIEVDEAVPRMVLPRSDIERVDHLRFDGTKTLRNVTFWGFSGAVLAMLLGERS